MNTNQSLTDFKDYINSQDIIDVLIKCNAINEELLQGRKYPCPFHDDNTPSLNFYENSYYCFGCSANGDAIKFLCELYSISYVQAMQMLAEVYDVELSYKSINPFLSKNKSNQSLEQEWKYYLEEFSKAGETIKQNAKIFFPLEVGYDPKMKYYVFRYTSKTNKTLGFTKRRAFETEDKTTYPKWKHSSKKKSNIEECACAYNLGNAISPIRKTQHLIIVEGVKDIIPWIVTGKKEVIALSGTHHFSATVSILPEFKTLTLSLDGDEAGIKGMKDIVKFLAKDFSLDDINYVNLKGKDPYDYYQEYKRMPECSSVLELFENDLKTLFQVSNDYNRDLIVSWLSKNKSIVYSEAESFFDTTKKQKRLKKADELKELTNSKDADSLVKLKLKYGIE